MMRLIITALGLKESESFTKTSWLLSKALAANRPPML